MDEPLTVDEQAKLAGYEHDFFLWTQQQAALLRARNEPGPDWDNIAEEIESLGRRDKREIDSRLESLVLHLLKWSYQPEKRKGEWQSSIRTQRNHLLRVIEESPSLRSRPAQRLAALFPGIRRAAAEEMRLVSVDQIPADCPFGVAEILDPEWLPGSPERG